MRQKENNRLSRNNRLLMHTAILIQLLLFSTAAASGLYPYVSPGLQFGWHSTEGLSFTVKISAGIYDHSHQSFGNITFGSIQTTESRCYFTELEGGSFVGGGLGIGWYQSYRDTSKIWMRVPKASLFTGGVIWIRHDTIFKTPTGTKTNLGCMTTVPITSKGTVYDF